MQGLDYLYTLQGWLKAVNPVIPATGGTAGNGEGCAEDTSSATSELAVDTRVGTTPLVYTARTAIYFEPGFTSPDVDRFETKLDTLKAPCSNGTYTSMTGLQATDGYGSSKVGRDAYSYLLNYYDGDYRGIAVTSPSAAIYGQLGSSYRPLYNGNISSMAVSINKLQQPILYSYGYDQLNRLVAMDAWKTQSSVWNELKQSTEFNERVSYDANGNILKYKRNGNTALGQLAMDSLTYNYYAGTNQLSYVRDTVGATRYADDIDNQAANNYAYDSIGNLIADNAGNIATITWTVYGKINTITKTDGSTISYLYDASGNRIRKKVSNSGGTTIGYTWYVRDAGGNVMSTYTINDSINSGHLTQTEADIYGSSRLGMWRPNRDVESIVLDSSLLMPGIGSGTLLTFTRGKKFFELNNHLGNVLVTVSDKKLQVDGNNDGTIDYYLADVQTANDYYPFGR